ncbi:MAG: hypothetical protein ABFD64_13255 [Armatimonadota bacterium]
MVENRKSGFGTRVSRNNELLLDTCGIGFGSKQSEATNNVMLN